MTSSFAISFEGVASGVKEGRGPSFRPAYERRMSDSNDASNPNRSSAASNFTEAPPPPPSPPPPPGVDEQVEADDNERALRDFGLVESELHDCAVEASRDRANARPYLHPWHLYGIFSAYLFAHLAERLLARGWACIVSGACLWLRSPDKRFGLVLWQGNGAVGKRGTRAHNVRAKGQEIRSMLESVGEFIPGLDLGDSVIPTGEDGEGIPFVTPLGAEEYPQEFLALLIRRTGNIVQWELQVLPKEALSGDGFLQNTRQRVFLHPVEVQSVPTRRPVETQPQPTPTEDEIEVPMAPVDEGPEGTGG
ncbi:MAG: hypothetical protein JWM10_3138 [Myxococcaceae bacterium]|nr:hypothetical protein [Myxococcaceae bacterium]